MGALTDLRILVPESRELDLFSAMLEAEGASVWRCPLVQILDLDDRREADLWIDRFISGAHDELILLTGEGLRRLVILSEAKNLKEAFIARLAQTPTITRGPKPARALKELGLSPTRAAPTPTSAGVLDLLAGEDLTDRNIGLQLYPGDGGLPLTNGLIGRGATIDPVTPYRYASESETERVAEAIRDVIAGRVDAIAFTSSPQIDRLLDVAQSFGLMEQFRHSLDRVKIAAIGPVVEATLQKHNLPVAIRPSASFHLKPLIRAMRAAWPERSNTD